MALGRQTLGNAWLCMPGVGEEVLRPGRARCLRPSRAPQVAHTADWTPLSPAAGHGLVAATQSRLLSQSRRTTKVVGLGFAPKIPKKQGTQNNFCHSRQVTFSLLFPKGYVPSPLIAFLFRLKELTLEFLNLNALIFFLKFPCIRNSSKRRS